MIKIYGSPASSAGRCYWLLEELGLAYQQESLNMREKEHKSPEYTELNPNGKVPCLIDGDFILWESTAINFYLVERYRPELLGRGIPERAKAMQWSIWSQVEYQKPLIDLFIQKVFVPEERRSQEIMDKAVEKILPLNEILNDALKGRDYLIQDDFTVGDLNVASVARLNLILGIDTSHLDELNRWLSTVLARDAAVRVAEMSKSF